MEKQNKVYKIIFAGGGTGGHIYPGLAVADQLKIEAEKKDITLEIYWIGNKEGMDRDLVEKNLVPNGGSITAFYGIPCGKLRRYFSLKNFIDFFKIIKGYFESRSLIKKIKPDCLFSKGGFVSVPPCWAAKRLKVPYYTHECDFTPGLATRLNSKGAKNILLSYEETKKYFPTLQDKCIVTGNPVRPVFYSDQAASGRSFLGIPEDNKKLVLLVLGGSSGAMQINDLIVENLSWLKERFILVHQTGQVFAKKNPLLLHSSDSLYKPYAFIYSEMPAVIQAADLIISRAGANSLWECAVCSKAMLLVPLCGSGTRGDQVDNAKYFESKGAAYTLVGDEVNSQSLKNTLELLLDKQNRDALSNSCKKLCGSTLPSKNIADIVLKGILGESSKCNYQ